MAVPSVLPSDITHLPLKPSLRQRLFSSASRKSNKQADIVDGLQPPENPTPSTGAIVTGDAPELQEQPQDSTLQRVHSIEPGLSAHTDEIDKEQGSLNTTLTGHNRRIPFYRRKGNKSSTSEGALSASTALSIIKVVPGPSRSRPSFLSRVVHRVVPCVNPAMDSPHNSDENSPAIGELQSSLALKDVATVNQEPSLLAHSQNRTAFPSDTCKSPSSSTISGGVESSPPSDSDVLVPPPPSTHLLPEEETDGMTSGAVQPPGSTGEKIIRSHTMDSSEDSDGTSYTDDDIDHQQHMRDEQDEEDRLIKNGGSGIPIGPDGVPKPLLPPIAPEYAGRKCLVLDLDETLVHSSFKAIQQPDFIVPVEIEYHWHHFHVLKRPGVDDFLKKMGEIYEIVIFTASLSKYADPVLDKLDLHHVVAHRLFRESCFSHKGNYVKDLSQLGRPIADTIILDNSPASYIFHPNNAVPVSSWFNDPHDAELTDLIPFLADLTSVPDVRGILDGAR